MAYVETYKYIGFKILVWKQQFSSQLYFDTNITTCSTQWKVNSQFPRNDRERNRNEKKKVQGEVSMSKTLQKNIDRCNEEVPVENINSVAQTLVDSRNSFIRWINTRQDSQGFQEWQVVRARFHAFKSLKSKKAQKIKNAIYMPAAKMTPHQIRPM